jgi:Flp pilus assembly protein TadD
MQSAQGGQLNWALPLELVPADEHPLIKAAAPLVVEGRALEAVQSLSAALLPDATPATQGAAGQMALAIKQAGLAQQLFQSVQKAEPKNGCAPIGLASVALWLNDWDTASKTFWAAREMVPRDQRPASPPPSPNSSRSPAA